MNKDFCSDISVIPQFKNYTWFNAILMVSFYSQAMRKLMIKQSKTWKKKSNLHNFLKTILKKNYKSNNNETIRLFNKINPQSILLNILFKYDIPMMEKLNQKEIEWNIIYISLFLKFLKIKVLDITYLENDVFLFNYGKIMNNYLLQSNISKKLISEFKDKNMMIDYKDELKEIYFLIKNIPDVLILFHNNLNNTVKFHNNFYKNHKELSVFNSKLYTNNAFPNIINNLNDLKEYKEEIIFNGYSYKLDSILLDNYNGGKYSIAGINCNNNKYVYNGWYNNDCKLLKYNWNLNKENEFCFNNKKCNMEDVNLIKKIITYCFSFNKGDRVLIYVKENKEKTSSIKSKSYSSLSS